MSWRIAFDVSGYPPAKGEALSILGEAHAHAPRVRVLLEAAHSATENSDGTGTPLGSSPIGMGLVLRCPRDGKRSDATNYLGGIADVLEDKAHRAGQLDHLGDLARVSLYDNDRQIEEVFYRWEQSQAPSYSLTLWWLKS
jgi:hypothetical protein